MLIHVFLNPSKAFNQLSDAEYKHCRFLLVYALPLLLLGAFGRMLGTLMHQGTVSEALRSESAFGMPLVFFTLHLLVFAFSFTISSAMMARMASHFGGNLSQRLSLRLILLSYTPFLIVQPIVAIGGYWAWLGFAGLLYTIILYIMGLKQWQCVPENKIAGFTLISFFILLGTSYIISRIVFAFLIFEG